MADATSQVLPRLGSAAKSQDTRILAHATAQSDIAVNLMTPLLNPLHQAKLPVRGAAPARASSSFHKVTDVARPAVRGRDWKSCCEGARQSRYCM